MLMKCVIIAASVFFAASALSQEVPPVLSEAITKIASDAPENRVLNQLQAATLALDLGRQEDAAQLFDDALFGITSVYANNQQAADARSLWQNEGSKDFKGEPYERAMAFYYRGLLDMRAGDYENARASFKSAMLQDAFAEDAQHQTDFALMMFLEGWCSHVLGSKSLADEAFAELAEFRPGFVRPAPDHNLLVIVETGKAPRKLQDGIGGNLLVYRQGKRFKEVGARAIIGDETVMLTPMESIYWQASTRGGRPVDGILEGQVQFKQNTENVAATISGIASEGALYAPLYGASNGAFAGVAAVAGLTTLMTSRVKTRADARYWNNLPDMVHVYTMARPKDLQEIKIEFLNTAGAVLPEFSQSRKVIVDTKGRGLVWARARRATDVDTK